MSQIMFAENARGDRRATFPEFAGATHVGRHRDRNGDCFAVRPDLGLFMVADGVRKWDGGDVAAKMAVDLVSSFLANPETTWPGGAPWSVGDPRATFVAAVMHAHNRIAAVARAARQANGRGMATTFAGVLVEAGAVHVAHVGDSRVYRLRGGVLEALTADHTVANELIWQGVPPETALRRPDRWSLSRALGVGDRAPVSARFEHAAPGDVLLLCTDGLHDLVPASELRALLLQLEGLEVGLNRLIECANDHGETDNITAILLRWETTDVRRRPRG